jgi:hypothetical protein
MQLCAVEVQCSAVCSATQATQAEERGRLHPP